MYSVPPPKEYICNGGDSNECLCASHSPADHWSITGVRHEIPVCAHFSAKAIAVAQWKTARRDDYDEP
jgi:hypothetical protein